MGILKLFSPTFPLFALYDKGEELKRREAERAAKYQETFFQKQVPSPTGTYSPIYASGIHLPVSGYFLSPETPKKKPVKRVSNTHKKKPVKQTKKIQQRKKVVRKIERRYGFVTGVAPSQQYQNQQPQFHCVSG